MADNKFKYVLPAGHILHGAKRDYIIEETLGKGGFGITYKVKAHILIDNIPFDLHFAVKEFFPDICSRDNDNATMMVPVAKQDEVNDGLKDFINEGRRLQEVCKISHNIVNVNEVFEANDTAYYVLEYLDGGDLRKMLRDNGRKGLSEQQMLDLMIPIGKAVQCLHNNHMLHLDIKPDNIVMRRNHQNNSYEPALIDFGIAVHFKNDGTPTSKTPSQGISPGYSPIEQYSQVKKFDPRLDVYAYSATCFYLLTGKDPIEALDMTPDFIKSVIPSEVSDNVAYAIEHGMSKEKSQRTGTIDEMLESLMAKEVPAKEPVTPLSNNEKKTRNIDPLITSADQEPLVNDTLASKDRKKITPNDEKNDLAPKKSSSKKNLTTLALFIAIALITGLTIWGMTKCSYDSSEHDETLVSTTSDASVLQENPQDNIQQEPIEDSTRPTVSTVTKDESPKKVEEQQKKETKSQAEPTKDATDNKRIDEKEPTTNDNPKNDIQNAQKKVEDAMKENNSNTTGNNNGTVGRPSIGGLAGYSLEIYPSAPCPGPGTVVVQVVVSPTGKVTKASVVGGSLKSNSRACEICRRLALRSTFRVPKNTAVEQAGTLTYTVR